MKSHGKKKAIETSRNINNFKKKALKLDDREKCQKHALKVAWSFHAHYLDYSDYFTGKIIEITKDPKQKKQHAKKLLLIGGKYPSYKPVNDIFQLNNDYPYLVQMFVASPSIPTGHPAVQLPNTHTWT